MGEGQVLCMEKMLLERYCDREGDAMEGWNDTMKGKRRLNGGKII